MNQKSDYHPDVIHCPEGNLRFRLFSRGKERIIERINEPDEVFKYSTGYFSVER